MGLCHRGIVCDDPHLRRLISGNRVHEIAREDHAALLHHCLALLGLGRTKMDVGLALRGYWVSEALELGVLDHLL